MTSVPSLKDIAIEDIQYITETLNILEETIKKLYKHIDAYEYGRIEARISITRQRIRFLSSLIKNLDI